MTSRKTVIDFTHPHVRDHSAVTAIAKVLAKYEQANKNAVMKKAVC
ncbi:hypothetical protein [Paenibacillus sp. MBLB4367]